MFVFDKIEGNDITTHEFEITGSTYEPIGEVFLGGKKVKTGDYDALQEIGTICIMCNDSAIDFNEVRNTNTGKSDILYFVCKLMCFVLGYSSSKFLRRSVKPLKPLLSSLLRR
jgi:hypothetical protein